VNDIFDTDDEVVEEAEDEEGVVELVALELVDRLELDAADKCELFGEGVLTFEPLSFNRSPLPFN
jgi:hypothetical protein